MRRAGSTRPRKICFAGIRRCTRDTLVSQKSLAEIFTPFKGGYGYGWSIGQRFDRQAIAHGGGIYGFATQVDRFPADRVTVIVLSNVETAPAGRMANDLAAIVFGARYEIPRERQAIPVEPSLLAQYVGQYQDCVTARSTSSSLETTGSCWR